MKKNFINQTHIEGYVYEHKLVERVSGPESANPNTPFINGFVSIATDDDCMNVIQVHFIYVTATTPKGPNTTYNILKSIIDGGIKTVMADGKDKAGMLRIDSAIGLNEWYDAENNLITVRRNEGGFVHQTNTLNDDVAARATFNTDIVINGCTRMEANEERNLPERLVIKGAVFSYRNELLPVEFMVYNPAAMDYFESLEATGQHPVFTRVQGSQVSQTIVKTTTEESAFGPAKVKETKSSFKEFVVTWAQQEPYVWDDESSILASELGELVAAREVRKAEIKKRQDEYKAKKATASSAIPTAAPSAAKSQYNF